MRRLLTAALLAVSLAAHAGQTCEDQPLTTRQVELGLTLAQQTAEQLDASGAQVVLLARAGQDLSAYRLQWSHFGIAYRVPPGPGCAQPAPQGGQATRERPFVCLSDEATGAWRVLHKLNDCGTADAAIYRQGLGDFFLDRPHRYEAAYVVPEPALQQQLLAALAQPTTAVALHEPHYSMVAYAWGQTYQQSNQWALETLALAAAPQPVPDRRAAQAWLRAQGYHPTDLRINTAKRLGARLTRANIAFDDHPTARRFAGHIETVTVDSVFDWLTRSGRASAPVRVVLQAVSPAPRSPAAMQNPATPTARPS
ncbi:DUF2145 domain-containing protein [Roseateles paludis]|uniref:DUF2145 domain-containing protein n=1 Tax=Roseateles paludis TaxID=3145238 RepID=A0ABV0FXW2_9BURK